MRYPWGMEPPRDFSTISPSAIRLLVLKSQTSLPYAEAAAEALLGADAVPRELAASMALRGAELRLRHFVERYRSVDALLSQAGATRVLELASGLSFRGLALAEREPVHYLDTDLPDMTATKQRLVAALHPGPLVGVLRVAPLDILDGEAFRAAVDWLPPGPVTVANEGLLMYLGADEKARLCGHVRAALAARGGVWITADVYLRVPPDPRVEKSERLQQFLDAHRVEENKFESFAAAERLFADSGLRLERRLADASRTRETWALVAR